MTSEKAKGQPPAPGPEDGFRDDAGSEADEAPPQPSWVDSGESEMFADDAGAAAAPPTSFDVDSRDDEEPQPLQETASADAGTSAAGARGDSPAASVEATPPPALADASDAPDPYEYRASDGSSDEGLPLGDHASSAAPARPAAAAAPAPPAPITEPPAPAKPRGSPPARDSGRMKVQSLDDMFARAKKIKGKD